MQQGILAPDGVLLVAYQATLSDNEAMITKLQGATWRKNSQVEHQVADHHLPQHTPVFSHPSSWHGARGYQSLMVHVIQALLLMLAGVLVGYMVGSRENGITELHYKLKRLQQPASIGLPEYTVFNTSWPLADWTKHCSKPGTEGLCSLPKVWRNCQGGLYLDVGTNLGVQIRKLYNPEQFPEAAVLPIFNQMFGEKRVNVCSIGIEANPHHTRYLDTLNKYFKQKAYPSVIVTEMAAAVRSGKAIFHLDNKSPAEWGASLAKGAWQQNGNASSTEVEVQLFPLPRFVAEVVRPIVMQIEQVTGKRPPVVMKLDVEGAEYSLLPAMMLNGALCDLDVLFLEVHPERMRVDEGVKLTVPHMKDLFSQMRKAQPQCTVNIMDLDDESYLHGDKIPLPP